MTNQNSEISGRAADDYRQDMVGILRALFRRKGLVATGIFSFTLLGLVLALVLPKVYLSEGVYQFSMPDRDQYNPLFSVASDLLESSQLTVFAQLKDMGMLELLKELNFEVQPPNDMFVVTIQDFKRYVSSFGSFQAYLQFVKRNKLLSTAEIDYLKKKIKDSRDFARYREEIYALSRDDMKNMGQTLGDEKNYVVGVEIKMEGKDPDTARRFLDTLGQFIGFRIFHERLNEYITSRLVEANGLVGRYENYLINNRSTLNLLARQRDKLRVLNNTYRGITGPTEKNAQLVFMESSGHRYLSPVSQLIAVESRIIELERIRESITQEKAKCRFYASFFGQLKTILEKKTPADSQDILTRVRTFTKDFFKVKQNDGEKSDVKKLGDDQVSVLNSITSDLERFETLNAKILRFIAGPSLPEKPEWPKKSIFVIFGFFLGSLIFIFAALSLEFWRQNKGQIREQ